MRKLKILTVAEVATILRVHPATVYRLVKTGDLPAFRIGENWRITSDVLKMWLSERRDHSLVSRTGS